MFLGRTLRGARLRARRLSQGGAHSFPGGAAGWAGAPVLLAVTTTIVAFSEQEKSKKKIREVEGREGIRKEMREEIGEEKRVERGEQWPVIPRSAVQQHTSEETGVWVTHNEGVYDITSFLANHPGGREKLMLAAGKDLSEMWQQLPFQLHYRSPLVFELLEEHRVGTLPPEDIKTDSFFQDAWDNHVTFNKADKVYSPKQIYDCIIIGAGLAGLQCANTLKENCTESISNEDILILEASDYIGGRVKQVKGFVAGIPIDVGAEFLHGTNTMLARNAVENGDDLKELFCWAQGDGGPLSEPASNGGFGLYYFGGKGGRGGKGRERLLRFDDKDKDFNQMNKTLSELSSLNELDYTDDESLEDYLKSQNFSDEMLSMAEAGFSNTMCTNSRDLSLKQSIRWSKFWDEEEGDDGDYVFVNSFENIINRLKTNLQVELNSPVVGVQHPQSADDIGLIKLTVADGTVYFAKNVVVTSPPPVIASKIDFSPPLAVEVNQALQTVVMHDVIKIFLKFSEPAWPKDLHGMIMAGNEDFLVPEVWFKDIDPSKVDEMESAKGLAICYATANFAERISKMPKEEVLQQVLKQLDRVFSRLRDNHMSATADSSHLDCVESSKLKRPSDVYMGGMFWDWNSRHHPYISGGYCSAKAGKKAELIKTLTKPYYHGVNSKEFPSSTSTRIYFAGEATNESAGATAHAAMASGLRAAEQVAENLRKNSK